MNCQWVGKWKNRLVFLHKSTFKKWNHIWILLLKKRMGGEFLGGPVVRTPRFHCRGPGSIHGGGTKTMQATRCSQKKERKKRLGLFKNGRFGLLSFKMIVNHKSLIKNTKFSQSKESKAKKKISPTFLAHFLSLENNLRWNTVFMSKNTMSGILKCLPWILKRIPNRI